MTIVSVLMITYNHENFIREAIEGVLMQKTDFAIELIIGEDCSTDNTRKIILEYAYKYPKIIRPLLPEKNLGMSNNFLETLKACTGKYIALCEGDDYWTDPNKLQKQVDFLEANEEYSASAHQSEVAYSNSVKTEQNVSPYVEDKILYIKDLIQECNFQTASFIFRKSIFDIADTFPLNVTSGDRALFLMCCSMGPIMYFKTPMSVYRKHPGGVSANLSPKVFLKDLNMVPWLLSFNRNFPKNALYSFIYFTIIVYTHNISTFQLIKYYFIFLYYYSRSEIEITELKKEAMNSFAYKLPKQIRRVIRQFGLIK